MSGGTTSRWNASQIAAAILLLVLHAVLAWSLRVPGLTTIHDDAWYLSLARALRLGSYVELPIVGTPTHSMYPPLYPALLALLHIDRPDVIAYGVAVNIALSMLALGLAARLASRISSWCALALLAICVPNPLLLDRASSISSEPLFMATSFLALLLLSGAGPPPRAVALGATAVLAATLSRSIGLSLLLATLTHWLLQQQWRRASALVVAAAFTTGAWLLWTVRAPRLDAGRSYIADAVYKGSTPSADTVNALPSAPAGPTASPSLQRVIAERVRFNVPSYAARGIPSAVALPMVPRTPIDNLVWSALLIVSATAGLVLLRRSMRLAGMFLVLYLGILAVWPYVLDRFLAPTLPLLVLFLVVGAGWLVERAWGIRARPAFVGGFVALISVSALRRDAVALRVLSACDRHAPRASAACFTAEQRDFFAAAALARAVTPDTARFLSSKEATLYQLTGRQSVREAEALSITDPGDFARYLRRNHVGYILLSRMHLDQWGLGAVLVARCEEYAVVARFGAHAALLRVREAVDIRGHGSTEACLTIERWASGDWEP